MPAARPGPGSVSPSGAQQTQSHCDSLHKTDISLVNRLVTPHPTKSKMLALAVETDKCKYGDGAHYMN